MEVIQPLKDSMKLNLEILPFKNAVTDISSIKNIESISAVIIQSPNKYGIIESWNSCYKKIKKSNAILISISNPLMLSKINPPGNCGSDIFIADGQCLGNYMNYGGPSLGIMSVKNKFIRKIPGRIIGRTLDKKGKEGFVLTLQTLDDPKMIGPAAAISIMTLFYSVILKGFCMHRSSKIEQFIK